MKMMTWCITDVVDSVDGDKYRVDDDNNNDKNNNDKNGGESDNNHNNHNNHNHNDDNADNADDAAAAAAADDDDYGDDDYEQNVAWDDYRTLFRVALIQELVENVLLHLQQEKKFLHSEISFTRTFAFQMKLCVTKW